MTPDDAFLQAIVEAPDDDTPRLIYADWLEERGDPRGEFIRLQCRLDRLLQPNDSTGAPFLIVGDSHTPGNQGPTFAGLSQVPPGETFTREPENGAQLP